MTCTLAISIDADPAEVELALEHRKRHDRDRGDQEHRRVELEQPRRLRAEQRHGDQRDDEQRQQRQDDADDERQQRALSTCARSSSVAARARCRRPRWPATAPVSPMIVATATRPNSAGGTRCASTTAEPTAVTSAARRASVAQRRLLKVFSLSSCARRPRTGAPPAAQLRRDRTLPCALGLLVGELLAAAPAGGPDPPEHGRPWPPSTTPAAPIPIRGFSSAARVAAYRPAQVGRALAAVAALERVERGHDVRLAKTWSIPGAEFEPGSSRRNHRRGSAWYEIQCSPSKSASLVRLGWWIRCVLSRMARKPVGKRSAIRM